MNGHTPKRLVRQCAVLEGVELGRFRRPPGNCFPVALHSKISVEHFCTTKTLLAPKVPEITVVSQPEIFKLCEGHVERCFRRTRKLKLGGSANSSVVHLVTTIPSTAAHRASFESVPRTLTISQANGARDVNKGEGALLCSIAFKASYGPFGLSC